MKLKMPIMALMLIILLFGSLFVYLHNVSSSNDGTTQKHCLSFDGMERSYLLHVSPNYNNSTPTPLVVVLHGGLGTSENVENTTGFSKKADEENFIVVYPQGIGRTWNSGNVEGPAFENQVDDVGFILKIVEEVENNYNIDENRIYATGISNGAMMSYKLASDASDKFAAIAPVAGTIGGKSTENASLYFPKNPSQSVSVIIFHGTNDQHVIYNGGRSSGIDSGRIDLSVNDSVLFWVEADKCSSDPVIENITSNVYSTTYKDGLNATEVVLYVIVGGGHAWPGGEKGFIFGDEPTQEISATDLIWEFFKIHPKG